MAERDGEGDCTSVYIYILYYWSRGGGGDKLWISPIKKFWNPGNRVTNGLNLTYKFCMEKATEKCIYLLFS